MLRGRPRIHHDPVTIHVTMDRPMHHALSDDAHRAKHSLSAHCRVIFVEHFRSLGIDDVDEYVPEEVTPCE